MSRPLRITALALIGLFGLAAAIARSADSLSRIKSPSAALSTFDSLNIVRIVAVTHTAGTPLAQDLEVDDRVMFTKFGARPWSTLAHVLPSVLFMLLAPLQFSRRIRRRYPAFHRWSGRVVLSCVLILGVTGIYFGVAMPFGGVTESIPVALFGFLYLFAAAKGFAAIRRRDITSHRRWMTRMVAVAFGVSVERVLGLPIFLLTHQSPRAWFVTSIWLGFGISVAVAEFYLRRDVITAQAPALAPAQ